MKKVCLYVQDMYLNNEIFNEFNAKINKNDILAPYRHMKKIFARNGFYLDTQDITPVESADAVLYCEMPPMMPAKEAKRKSYLFACETDMINPRNWIKRLHKNFKTIFTVLVYKNDHAEFIKVNYPQPVRERPVPLDFNSKKLCTMIAGAKLSFHPLELYSARMKWIQWFTKNHPEDFEFYGTGWKHLIILGPIYQRIFNKIPYLTDLFRPSLKLYKGLADDKFAVLNKFKFSICFENAKGIPGNLSEKIFDCFFSNNVPVYLGASDIYDYIPKDCFIDANEFSNMEQLYHFMKSMPESKYIEYLSSAQKYLESESFKQHSIEQFAGTMANKIIKDLTS